MESSGFTVWHYILWKCFSQVLYWKCGSFLEHEDMTDNTHSCIDICGKALSVLRYPISIRVWGIVAFIYVQGLSTTFSRINGISSTLSLYYNDNFRSWSYYLIWISYKQKGKCWITCILKIFLTNCVENWLNNPNQQLGNSCWFYRIEYLRIQSLSIVLWCRLYSILKILNWLNTFP